MKARRKQEDLVAPWIAAFVFRFDELGHVRVERVVVGRRRVGRIVAADGQSVVGGVVERTRLLLLAVAHPAELVVLGVVVHPVVVVATVVDGARKAARQTTRVFLDAQLTHARRAHANRVATLYGELLAPRERLVAVPVGRVDARQEHFLHIRPEIRSGLYLQNVQLT